MAEPYQVEVVAADRRVWEGRAVNVIVRTTEGDIGILPGHEPLLAALVPCAAEIVTAEGGREVIALDGGFVSVTPERVSLLAQYASLATEVKPEQAQRELDKLQVLMDSGDATDEEQHRYHLAVAQLAVLRRQGNEPH
ncbi:ATP synthase epsilon chain [Aestuariimicrobium sp. T2.26MG-19.2B]|uniref:F0F1 ATP synthase subunit epsilon n=1 Tax=Aestuariimicrobium sp. T2.26MG-19.2B TaxID=3040679 RepID=UPI002477BD03|nr:F0F1 ATP synthase subunit epsilon [Aestuariimicrobium sp. T2.26MG-19.2B]CAI9410365.1 ATP synthase epsilon chain [Aestuariimicrobium sp. T2.26MG-19.2B]